MREHKKFPDGSRTEKHGEDETLYPKINIPAGIRGNGAKEEGVNRSRFIYKTGCMPKFLKKKPGVVKKRRCYTTIRLWALIGLYEYTPRKRNIIFYRQCKGGTVKSPYAMHLPISCGYR
jgi:hypothetical protein